MYLKIQLPMHFALQKRALSICVTLLSAHHRMSVIRSEQETDERASKPDRSGQCQGKLQFPFFSPSFFFLNTTHLLVFTLEDYFPGVGGLKRFKVILPGKFRLSCFLIMYPFYAVFCNKKVPAALSQPLW